MILVYAIVSMIISVAWLGLDLYLVWYPRLLNSPDEVKWMRAHAWTQIGTIVGAAIGFGIAFVSPLATLFLYVIIGAGFLVVRLRDTLRPQGDDGDAE